MLESPSRSDGDLLRLLSGGDEKAFIEFYRKHQGVVYRFALQMSGKTEIAEEVTQDVFVVVMNSGDTIRQRARLGGGVSLWDRAEFRAAGFGARETLYNGIGRSGGRLCGPG